MRILRLRIPNTGSKEYIHLLRLPEDFCRTWLYSVHSLPFPGRASSIAGKSPHQWAVSGTFSSMVDYIPPSQGLRIWLEIGINDGVASDQRIGLLFLITEGQRLWKGQLGKNNRVNLLHLKSASRDLNKKDKNNKMCSQWRVEVKKLGENGKLFQTYLLLVRGKDPDPDPGPSVIQQK